MKRDADVSAHYGRHFGAIQQNHFIQDRGTLVGEVEKGWYWG